MSKKYNLYLGKAGQFVVMSHFLMRGWNVAIPEVDVGDDLFVVEDKKGIFYRVQVKTAQSIERQNAYGVQFNLPVSQLQAFIDPEIYYTFVVCPNQVWSDILIVPRPKLYDLYAEHQIGSLFKDKQQLLLYFIFQADGKITCSGQEFTHFRNNFNDFPMIQH
jgi:hypothetical protein